MEQTEKYKQKMN